MDPREIASTIVNAVKDKVHMPHSADEDDRISIMYVLVAVFIVGIIIWIMNTIPMKTAHNRGSRSRSRGVQP